MDPKLAAQICFSWFDHNAGPAAHFAKSAAATRR
jgi:hypothetical protein